MTRSLTKNGNKFYRFLLSKPTAKYIQNQLKSLWEDLLKYL